MTTESFRNLNAGDWVTTRGLFCEIKERSGTFPHEYKILCWGATKLALICEADCASFETCLRPSGTPSPPEIDEFHPDKIRLTTCCDGDFNLVMTEIDSDMASDEVPIFSRELFGITYLCKKFKFSLGLHEPLALRLRDWISSRYGDRLNIDLSTSFPVMIGLDIYKLRIPFFVSGQVICVRSRNVAQIRNVPILNVLDHIEGLTDERRSLIFSEDLIRIRSSFLEANKLHRVVSGLRNEVGFVEAFGDLENAVNLLFNSKPQLGSSRWSSLQAAEKFLKGWLRRQGSSGWGHDLVPLAEQAEALGLPATDRTDLSIVQCSPNVRYNAAGIRSSEAVAATHSTLRICAHVAENL